MSTNNFKPFAIGSSANVTAQSDYEALAALLSGFSSGKASSAQINKALRQSSTMAYVLAQFISDSASVDVLDNGTPATILANMKAGMAALSPGRRIGSPRVFTASGVYTPTTGTNWIEVLVVGAGGGGGGASATSSGYMAGGSGGGGGGYAMSRLTSGFSGVQVTVGIAGVGGDASPSNGGKGGDSSFGTLVSATGGVGGEKQPGVKNTALTLQLGAAGGVGSSGNIINSSGGAGGTLTLNTDSNSTSGTGGSSYLSGATKGAGTNSSGNSGMLGGGGSGAVSGSSPNTGYSGGSGGGGCVIIWEYS